MAIEVTQVKRIFKYNGVSLPDVPGLSNEAIRDLYSAQYQELLSSEIQVGEVVRGVQQIEFRRAVGTKG